MTAPGYQVPPNLYRDPTGVVGTRSLAWIVDLVLYVGLMLIVMPPFSPLAEKADVPEGMTYEEACSDTLTETEDARTCLLLGDTAYWTDDDDQIIQALVSLSWFVVVFVILQGLKGITPGKALVGLRVVRDDGQPPGIGRALLRSVLWIVDGQPCGVPLVGFICVLSTPGHRRVGDLAAKTYVVDKADAGRPVRLPGMQPTTAPAPGLGYGVAPPTGAGVPGYPTAQGPAWGTPPGAPGAPTPGPGTTWPSSPPTGPTPTTPAAPTAPSTSPQPGSEPGSTWGTWGGAPSDEAPTTPAAQPGAGETSPGTPVTGESPTKPADDETIPRPSVPSDPDAAPTDEPGAGSSTAPAPTPGPSTESSAPSSGTVNDTGAASSYKPQWDAARGTYIQWDPGRGYWLQWDDTAKQWKQL